MPWDLDVVEDSEDRVTVRVRVAGVKTPCVIEKAISLDAATARISVSERLTNTSAIPYSAMWGHHIAFGRPLLQPGCEITLPEGVHVIPHPEESAPRPRRIRNQHAFPWPNAEGVERGKLDLRVIPEQGTASEMLYITEFPDAEAWYCIHDPDRGIGIRVAWVRETMPFHWMWQELGSSL